MADSEIIKLSRVYLSPDWIRSWLGRISKVRLHKCHYIRFQKCSDMVHHRRDIDPYRIFSFRKSYQTNLISGVRIMANSVIVTLSPILLGVLTGLWDHAQDTTGHYHKASDHCLKCLCLGVNFLVLDIIWKSWMENLSSHHLSVIRCQYFSATLRDIRDKTPNRPLSQRKRL